MSVVIPDDTVSSGITTEQGRNTVYTNGSIVDAAEGSVQDLTATTAGLSGLQNVLGSVQSAGVIYNTLGLNAIGSQFAPGLQGALNGTAQGSLPGAVEQAIGKAGGFFFP